MWSDAGLISIANHNTVQLHGIAASQNRAKIMGVLNPIADCIERLLCCGCIRSVQNNLAGCVCQRQFVFAGKLCHASDKALMFVRLAKLRQAICIHYLDINIERLDQRLEFSELRWRQIRICE